MARILYWVQACSQKCEECLNFFIFSQIWLNCLMDYHHFRYITKMKIKTLHISMNSVALQRVGGERKFQVHLFIVSEEGFYYVVTHILGFSILDTYLSKSFMMLGIYNKQQRTHFFFSFFKCDSIWFHLIFQGFL